MPLYAEDLHAGMEFPFTSWTLTEEAILDYARQWDPLPMHIDPVAARSGPHGGVIASGLHTMAVYQRLIAQALWSDVMGIGGRCLQTRFTKPVTPGTTVTGHAVVEHVTHRPERGTAVIGLAAELIDDIGAVVLKVNVEAVILRRAGATPVGP
ncbi:MAG TPA: MaoC/PaaZ C-terminal domain-containing protein [Pseudonocardia sp.]|jgi:acyl dehydratase|nr:MaoC/PaaZ C-terminal domain-containing protein [Pseudonocardia sp.]